MVSSLKGREFSTGSALNYNTVLVQPWYDDIIDSGKRRVMGLWKPQIKVRILRENTDIIVRKLSIELINDYLDFFDNYAFCDGSEFTGCYCVWYHWTDELEKERSKCSEDMKKCFKRNLAINSIKQRRLNGFLAYSNGKVIGWCNADLKQNYAQSAISK
jgi:hypothetical protein